jgi:hypothetical protein
MVDAGEELRKIREVIERVESAILSGATWFVHLLERFGPGRPPP